MALMRSQNDREASKRIESSGFQLQKSRQLFLRVRNKTLSVRRDARQQSRLFVPENPRLRRNRSSNRVS
jgi:hypothetical protein